MTNLNCCCKCNCTGYAIVASIIIGIITAFLTITAAITITPVFLWVLFGISILYLAVTLAVSSASNNNIRGCICSILPVLLTGILGTILISVILLAITFAATSILGAIISGALLLFFSLAITSTACLVKCVAGCSDN